MSFSDFSSSNLSCFVLFEDNDALNIPEMREIALGMSVNLIPKAKVLLSFPEE